MLVLPIDFLTFLLLAPSLKIILKEIRMESNTKTKIVFMGGNLIGCSCLKYLYRLKNTKILLVVGRYFDNGSVIEPKVWNASLTRLALKKSLPFVQPKYPRNKQFINDIQRLERPDFIFTAGYDKILDPELLNIPKIGTINIHFSPLPKHRGFFPEVWSILEDEKGGVTLHWVNNEINGGDIIDRETVSISTCDTSFDLYLKLSKVGLKILKKNFPQILKGGAPRIHQNETAASYHAAGYPFQRIINWNRNSQNIDRFIRALTFPGFESARTFYNNMEINVLQPVEVHFDSNGDSRVEPGTLLDIRPDGIFVKTADGKLLIKKIQINKSMPIDAYKLSKLFTLKTGDKFKSFETLSSDGKLNLIVP